MLISYFLARGVAIDSTGSIYVSDSGNHRIIKWEVNATQGIVVLGGNGNGSRTDQLSTSGGIILDDNGTIYVADEENNRVLSVPVGARNGTVIAGGHGQGSASNQLNRPISLTMNLEGQLYVSDWNNFRVQMFSVGKNPSSEGGSSYTCTNFRRWALISCFLSTTISASCLLK